VAIQVQIQALLVREARRGNGKGEGESREVGRGREIKVAKPQIFDSTSSKVTGFIMACKLYIRMKMRCYSARMWTDFRVRVSGQE